MPAKQTLETWIEKAREKHSDKFDYSSVEYVNQNTEITVICLTHNHSFTCTPKSHLKTVSGGCKLCDSELKSINSSKNLKGKPSSKRKSTEQFVEESKALHGDKYGYDRCVYTGTHNTVELYCNTCNEYFKTYAGDHIKVGKACGCPSCGLKNRKPRLPKRTYDQLVEDIKKVRLSQGNDDMDNYIISNDRELYPLDNNINIYCKKHDLYSTRYLGDLLKNNRVTHFCDTCSLEVRRTSTEELEADFKRAKDHFKDYYDYSLIDLKDFKSLNHSITIICPKHGPVPTTWDRHFKLLNHCNKCSKSYSLEDIIQLVDDNKKDYISTQYLQIDTNNSNFVKDYVLRDMYCTVHNKKFTQTYNAFRDGFVGCPSCNISSTSASEKRFTEWLKTTFTNMTVVENYKPKWLKFDSNRPKELDIFVPELNLAVEYNGTYYHSVEFDPKFDDYHQRKYEKCLENGINLLHIFEFENIDKWKKKIANYLTNPEKYVITYVNHKRSVRGYTCYGQSYIKIKTL